MGDIVGAGSNAVGGTAQQDRALVARHGRHGFAGPSGRVQRVVAVLGA